MKLKYSLASFASLAFLTFSASSAYAQSWNLTTGGNWDDTASWNPTTIPNAIDATTDLNTVDLAATGTYVISAATPTTFTIGTLNFGNNSTGNTVNLSTAANVGLIFDVTTGAAALNIKTNGGSSTYTLNSAIQLNDNLTSTVSRNGNNYLIPVIAGAVNVQGNTWNIGSMNESLTFTGLISGAGSINAGFVDHGSIRDTKFTNTASTFSGGTSIGPGNRIVLGSGSNYTGTGGGGILGTGTISVAATSTTYGANSATLQSNGAYPTNDSDTTTNILANNIDVASGRFLNIQAARVVNYTGTLSGAGTIVKTAGASNGSRAFAINTANSTFTGRVEIQDGQVATRITNALGSSATIKFNPANNVNGVGLFGSTVSGTDVSIGSTLEFARTASGNSQFITTAGNSTFTLSGNFSNSGSGTAGYIGLGRGNNVVTNVGGGYALGTNTGTATIRLTGTGALENNIGIVNGTTTASVLSLGNTSGTQTFSGIVSGNGSLVRNGAGGTTILSGDNTYSGTTTITAGTLLANNTTGSGTGTGTVAVASGATLGGTGIISGAITSPGIIAPGDGIGTLTANAGVILSGSLNAEVNATSADSLVVTGNVDLTGAVLNLTTLATPTVPSLILVSYSGTLTGNAAVPATANTFVSVNGLPPGYVLVNDTSLKQIRLEGGSPSGNYNSWAAANGVTGGVNGDSDNDGILNSVEYALNTNLNGSDGSVGTFTDGTLSFTKRQAAIDNGDVTYVIETSPSLAIGSWTPQVTQLPGNPANTNPITYTLPTGQGKIFGRLQVTIQP